MLKKFIPIILTLLLAGLGCKGLSTAQQAAIKPVTLNYWTVFDDVSTLQSFANGYKQIRPYVTINIRQVRYEEFDKLFINALADDVPPDLISVNVRSLAKYQNRLAPMPASVNVASVSVQGTYAKETVVTQQVNAMPTINSIKSNYIQTVGNDVISGGQIYGLPLAVDTLAVFYNKDLLDKSGVALPPTNWTEFTDAVKKTTKFDRNGNIIQSGVALGTDTVNNLFDILSVLVMQNGVDMAHGRVVSFADGLEKRVNDHPTMQALRFYTDFARPTKDVYSWNDKSGAALNAFASGKSVFYFGFAYDLPQIRAKAPQMNLEVLPLFQLNPSAPVNVASYWVESVVKKSPHQNEAWDFIRFMATPEHVKTYTAKTGQPTPLRAQIAEQSKDLVLAPFVSQILQAKNWYNGNDVDTATEALKALVRDYLQPYGEKDKPMERDANLIINAARIVQQTM